MTVKLLINGSPPHRLLDNVEVIGNLRLRYGILEKTLAVEAGEQSLIGGQA